LVRLAGGNLFRYSTYGNIPVVFYFGIKKQQLRRKHEASE
jgi:hypothetical protein